MLEGDVMSERMWNRECAGLYRNGEFVVESSGIRDEWNKWSLFNNNEWVRNFHTLDEAKNFILTATAYQLKPY